ncbi:hypothetical protein D1007_45390 [Hordeum vulgare]|nr:hypothetical protein D1007_45390 [Hordeum vulgare]
MPTSSSNQVQNANQVQNTSSSNKVEDINTSTIFLVFFLFFGSKSELIGASVDAAPVRRPASFFFAFELPEPSAAFFFADVFPFFGSDALGSFDGAAAARDGAGATPPVGVVIRGGKKRLRARPTVGGAPVAAAAAGARGSRLYSGVSGAPVCASMVAGALAPARAGAKEEGKGEFARALESAARGSGRPKLTARDEAMASAPNSF